MEAKKSGERFLNALILSIQNIIKCPRTHIIRASLTTLISSNVRNRTFNNSLNTKHWISRNPCNQKLQMEVKKSRWKVSQCTNSKDSKYYQILTHTLSEHRSRRGLAVVCVTEHSKINWMQNIEYLETSKPEITNGSFKIRWKIFQCTNIKYSKYYHMPSHTLSEHRSRRW